VHAGKIRHLGISLDPDDGARKRLNRAAEERVLPAAAELDLGVLACEPLANGYLSGKYRPVSRIASPDDWRSFHNAQELEAKLGAVARQEAAGVPAGVPLARWALALCQQHPTVSAVIPGIGAALRTMRRPAEGR
jgi:myo-inositol catabolism protein IolS